MENNEVKRYYCPIDALLQLIGGKYKAVILYNLLKGSRRYSELKQLLLGAKPDDAWTREDGHNFADVDAGIIGAHILFEVQALGLGTTWVGRIDPAKVVEMFPETTGYTIVGLFPIGVPSPESAGPPSRKHTTRKSVSEIASEL